MNDKEEKELIQDVKSTFVKWVIGTILTASVGLTAFYFNTNYVIAQNTNNIKEIKEDVKKINTVPVLNQNQIQQVQKEVIEIKENQKEFQKETKESIDDLRKQNLKMLELLYQINRKSN